MRENHGPVHLEEVLRPVQVSAESNSKEMVGYGLPLLCPGVPHHVGGDMALYQMGWPQVCHPTEKVEDAVPHGDQGGPAEDDGLPSVSWLGELGEDDASHAGLYEDPGDALDTHQQDGSAALSGGGSASVSDNINQSGKELREFFLSPSFLYHPPPFLSDFQEFRPTSPIFGLIRKTLGKPDH